MRRDFKQHLPLIAILISFSTLSYGQAWSGIIVPSRAIDWTKAGLPASFPDGETTPNPWTPPTRSTVCATVNPSGDTSGAKDVAHLNSAWSACTSGDTLVLAAGTWYINANLDFYGAGYGPDNVTVTGQGACNNPSICTIINGGANNIYLGGGGSGTSGALTATSYAKGTTQVTVASNPPTVGSIALFTQCDTGWSGSGCNTGAYTDNGAIFVCSNNGCTGGTGNNGFREYQQQYVHVTGVSGNTVTFTPGLYAPNWSSNNSAVLEWGGFGLGSGIQDINLINGHVGVSGCYACWIKGMRFVVSNNLGAYGGTSDSHCLFANIYVGNTYLLNAYPVIIGTGSGENGFSDSLVINNIWTNGFDEGGGSSAGKIYGYNYVRDTVTSDGYAGDFQHNSADFFQLREGNEEGTVRDDNTHGSHFFSTFFRNWISGGDIPFQLTGNPGGIELADFARFGNSIGNVVGWKSTLTGSPYAASYINGTLPTLYWIDQFSGDPLTLASSMRWGDYSICSGNADCEVSGGTFNSANVPNSTNMSTGTYPNAGPWQNPTPSTDSLPCSFFLQGFATSTTCTPYPSGGTGLSWWKVCSSWTTFPTSCASYTTQPFPPIGPDVTGGRSDANGYAYDIPAAVAWKNLPIDTTFQSSYAVTGSSWSSTNGGTETFTFASGVLPQCQVGNVCHLQGGFQLSTSNPSYETACTGGLSELLITSAGPSGSMPTSITYTLASNPGSNNCTGTMKFPDVRQFDERVYQTDSGDDSINPPTGLNAVVN